MPFPEHLHLTVSGIFGTTVNPAEEWSFGIKFGFPPTGSRNILDGWWQNAAHRCANAAGRFMKANGSGISTETILTRVRLAKIGPDGKVARDPDDRFHQVDSRAFTNDGRGVVQPLHPWQTCLAVSLQTDRPGPRGMGRFFVPATSIPVVEGNLISEAAQIAFGNAAFDFLQECGMAMFDVQRDPTIAAFPAVVSSYGHATPITNVRFGRRLDTQRRRGNDVEERYRAVGWEEITGIYEP